jgi:hypothetical protein
MMINASRRRTAGAGGPPYVDVLTAADMTLTKTLILLLDLIT